MAKLVHYLLTLVQLPPLTAKLEKVDLAPICNAIVEDLRSGDLSRSVTFEMDANMSLSGDRNLLTTAIACLLENAWKFTSKKDEGWIKVGLQPGKTTGEVVMVVTDNGAGFDPVYTEKLFTAFQRLHSSADFPGNGLGLAIVKRVAERHHGSVWAQTDKFGASFFMALPQVVVQEPLPEPAQAVDSAQVP
jgi:light-regulated signal transduction histidine kinase (bacteriophytochrome)